MAIDLTELDRFFAIRSSSATGTSCYQCTQMRLVGEGHMFKCLALGVEYPTPEQFITVWNNTCKGTLATY